VKLLIVSHTAHYLREDGRIAGWGPTVREISYLAELADEVLHVAFLHEGQPPASALPYSSDRVRLRFVRPSGGEGLRGKIGSLLAVPSYAAVVWRELRRADAVHVRCPANISLIAILLLALLSRPGRRWVKYAGNWKPDGREPLSYRLQRWWLRHNWHRAVVTVNGEWPGEPPHVRSFLNPCLTDEELVRGNRAAEQKSLSSPLRLLFVGALDSDKGAHRVLETALCLRERGVEVTLDVAGAGAEFGRLQNTVSARNAQTVVTLHGALPRPALDQLYERAHILLLPSRTEGWPKVLSEGMAYGVVPVAGAVSSIPAYLESFGCGKAVRWDDVQGFANAVAWYREHPDQWRAQSMNGARAARRFTYSNYTAAVRDLLVRDPLISEEVPAC
jgi:glycosyltransferase involved in cell wall biosynthesis